MRTKSAGPECDLGVTALASTGNADDHNANLVKHHERANQHAPKTVEEFRAAVLHLIDGGASEYGVAAALGVSVEQIRRLVGCRDCGE